MATKCDVAIVGGGPGGATAASFLKKYRPDLSVAIFEREHFPRDHVGESQLPLISKILDELGVWDDVESAGFPVKVGATYRWGNTDGLWDFNFLPYGKLQEEPRPGRYAGQRQRTAFQVDRSIYDKILLDHARKMGADVHEGAAVRSAVVKDDRIESVVLEDSTEVEARYFIDATGHSGLLRRALGIGIEEPSSLRNVAFWDYWTNAEWAVTLGCGGTRIQIMSVGFGWIWFIPITETRTSIGFVCPADYLKKSGKKPEELYLEAIANEPRISKLVAEATRENRFTTTKDWSFVAERLAGPNWYLVGEAAGFADPILSAGLTLTHSSAREAAFTIMEIERKGDKEWLNREYQERNRRRVHQHIRFADYWYTANANFTELKEFTREIAKDAGLELDAEAAFQWLGTGGFADELLGAGFFGTYTISGVHQIVGRLSQTKPKTAFGGYNGFVLDLEGAKRTEIAQYEQGRVIRIEALARNGLLLPVGGIMGWLVKGLQHSPRIYDAFEFIAKGFESAGASYTQAVQDTLLECLETLARDKWVQCKVYKNVPPLPEAPQGENANFHDNRDMLLPEGQRARSLSEECEPVKHEL